MIRVMHLSDLHLVDRGGLTFGKDCAANLAGVVDSVPAPPDVIVVTGDVAHEGSAGAYELARSMLSDTGCDVHYVAGNHDDATTMGGILGALDDVRLVPLLQGWTLALVSSRWDGHDAGRVSADTIAHLEEKLASTHDSVVVGVHHPPVTVCDAYDCSLVNRFEVDALLTRTGRVRVVLSGHLHDAFEIKRNGTSYLGGPSTFEQLVHGGDPHFRPTDAAPAARFIELGDDEVVAHRLFAARGSG